jgi:hypothetical protein
MINQSTARINRQRIIRNWDKPKGSHPFYQNATDAMMRAEIILSNRSQSFRIWLHDATQGQDAYRDGASGAIKSARSQLDDLIEDLTACRNQLH